MIGENTNNAFVSFIRSMMASLFSFKWKSIMPCERKLSIQEPEALVALFVTIQRREISVAKVRGEWDMLLLDMTVFQLWLWVSSTWNDYMGLNAGFVKAGSHFALPLNLTANLATGDRTQLQTSQTWEQKQLWSHVLFRVNTGYRSVLKSRLKNDASQFI